MYTTSMRNQSCEMRTLCAGHYCTAASPSRIQFRCGNSTVFCPRGSAAPTLVNDGFYGAFTGPDGGAQQLWDTVNETFSVELPCEPAYFCQGGVKKPCPPGECVPFKHLTHQEKAHEEDMLLMYRHFRLEVWNGELIVRRPLCTWLLLSFIP